MVAQHLAQGVDAIVWLGYGDAFPARRPDSWERAGELHRKLAEGLPPKPQAKLAVLRSYRAWALSSYSDGKLRNPGDWILQQLLDVWAVKFGQPYDVFELAPSLSSAEMARLRSELKKYSYLVSKRAVRRRLGCWATEWKARASVSRTRFRSGPVSKRNCAREDGSRVDTESRVRSGGTFELDGRSDQYRHQAFHLYEQIIEINGL